MFATTCSVLEGSRTPAFLRLPSDCTPSTVAPDMAWVVGSHRLTCRSYRNLSSSRSLSLASTRICDLYCFRSASRQIGFRACLHAAQHRPTGWEFVKAIEEAG